MGAVFRARDLALERDVAIKVLPPEAVATPERRRRFETEAKVVATLSHPGIVPVYDIGESDGIPFIVQELVDGETVEDVIRQKGPLDIDQIAEWGAQAAEALAAAHDLGILHRDVKPGNLIIGRDGRLRVLDFGLAKILDRQGRNSVGRAPLTNDNLVVGTVDYMSPEQAQGKEIDARSDVFSLGIVLYEMVAGRRPFNRASGVEVMNAIICDPAPPIETALSPVPDSFVTILEKCLEKLPDDRCESMREVSVDLRRFLRRSRGTTGVAPIVRSREGENSGSTGVRSERKSRGTRKWAGLLAGLLVILVIVTGAVLGLRRRAVPHSPISDKILLQTGFREVEPTFSPDGKAFVYASNTRGKYEIYYRLIVGTSSLRLTDLEGDCRHPVFSPGGDLIYFTQAAGPTPRPSIWTVPVLGGAHHRIVESGEQPHLSFDGKRMLFIRRTGNETALFVANVDGTGEKKILDGGLRALEGARFSHSGIWIFFLWHATYTGYPGDVWRIPVEGGDPVRLTNGRNKVWGHVEVLPDDSAVLFSSVSKRKFTIWKVPSRGGDAVAVLPDSSRLVWPSISPDGASLLVQGRAPRTDAWEFSLPDGEATRLTRTEAVWAPVRGSDGRLFFEHSGGGAEEPDIAVEDVEKRRVVLMQGSSPRLSRDEQRIYFSSGAEGGKRAIAVASAAGGSSMRLTTPDGIDDDPCATPDEKGVVFTRVWPDGKQSVMFLERETGSMRNLFDGDAVAPVATSKEVVFPSCTPAPGCGVYVVSLAGGAPRLLIPDGHYPTVTPDERTVYAWVGREWNAQAVSAPLDGSAPPRRLFDFSLSRDGPSWAIQTLNLSPDGRSLIATRQYVIDIIFLAEGVGVVP
jgi:serine/threonine protein kinase